MQCLTVHVVVTAVDGRSVELDFTDVHAQLVATHLRVVFTVVAARVQPNGMAADSASERNLKDLSSPLTLLPTTEQDTPSKSVTAPSGILARPWEISTRSTSGK